MKKIPIGLHRMILCNLAPVDDDKIFRSARSVRVNYQASNSATDKKIIGDMINTRLKCHIRLYQDKLEK